MHQIAAFSDQSGHKCDTTTHAFFFIRLPNLSGKFSLSLVQWFEMCSQQADFIAYSAENSMSEEQISGIFCLFTKLQGSFLNFEEFSRI